MSGRSLVSGVGIGSLSQEPQQKSDLPGRGLLSPPIPASQVSTRSSKTQEDPVSLDNVTSAQDKGASLHLKLPQSPPDEKKDSADSIVSRSFKKLPGGQQKDMTQNSRQQHQVPNKHVINCALSQHADARPITMETKVGHYSGHRPGEYKYKITTLVEMLLRIHFCLETLGKKAYSNLII